MHLYNLSVYETPTHFYVIGSDVTETRFNTLKIDRTSERDFIIGEPDHDYSKSDIGELLATVSSSSIVTPSDKWNKKRSTANGLLRTVEKAYGIVGAVQFLEGFYLLVVTKAKIVVTIGYHSIYKIEDVSMIYIPASGAPSHPDEQRYSKLFQSVDFTTNFYFSYSYDVSRTLQENVLAEKSLSWNKNVYSKCMPLEEKFVWNNFLLKPFRDNLVSNKWTLEIVHGYVGYNIIETPCAKLLISLIARRAASFAGTRFLKRGTNFNGDVANDVETEQIVWDVSSTPSFSTGKFASFVQRRGSVPFFWSQDPSNRGVVGKPPIYVDLVEPHALTTAAHFRELRRKYGHPIVVMNLVKRREKRHNENILHDQFLKLVKYLNQFRKRGHCIDYIGFDVSRCHSKSGKVLQKLELLGICEMLAHGWFQSFPLLDGIKKHWLFSSFKPHYASDGKTFVQHGISRTNCVDCLDRTNVAQFGIGKVALAFQLFSLGYVEDPLIALNFEVCRVLEELYDEHGDTLAWQYAGSQLVHSIKTYKKTAAFQERSRDVLQTLSRYYSNTFSDYEKQDGINLFLGMFRPIVQPQRLTNERYLHFNTSFRRVNEFLVWALNVSSDGEESGADNETLQVGNSSVNRLLSIDYKYNRRKRVRATKEKRALRYSLEHRSSAEHKRTEPLPDPLNLQTPLTVGSTPPLMASLGGTAGFTPSSASSPLRQLSSTLTAIRSASRANSNDLLSLLVPFSSILSLNDSSAVTIQTSPSFFGIGSIGTALTSPNGVASSLSLANFMTAAAHLNSQQPRRCAIASYIEAAPNHHNEDASVRDGYNVDALKGKTGLMTSSFVDDEQQIMLGVEDWILLKAEEAGFCDINVDLVMGTAINDDYGSQYQRFNSSLYVERKGRINSASSMAENFNVIGFSDVPFDGQSVTEERVIPAEQSDPFYMAHRLFELVSFDQMLKDSPLMKRIINVDALSNADGFCAFRNVMSTKCFKSPLISRRSTTLGDSAQSRGSTMSLIVEQRTTSDDGNVEENSNLENSTKMEDEEEEEYIQIDEDKNADPHAPTSICATLRCIRQYYHQRSVSPSTPTIALQQQQQQFQFSSAETDAIGGSQTLLSASLSGAPRKKRDSLLFTVNNDLQPNRCSLGLASGLKSPMDSYAFEFKLPSENDLNIYRKYADLQQQQQNQQLLFNPNTTATLLHSKTRNQQKIEQSQKRVQLRSLSQAVAAKSTASQSSRFPSRILNRMGSGIVVAATASTSTTSSDVSRRGSVPIGSGDRPPTSRWRVAGAKTPAVAGLRTKSLLRNMRSVDNADGSLTHRGENTNCNSSLDGSSALSSFCQLDPMFEFSPSFFVIDSAFHTVLSKVSEKSLAEYRRRVESIQGSRQKPSNGLIEVKAQHHLDVFEPSATACRVYAEYAVA